MSASIFRWPTYLRTVVTAKCPLSCSYCHMEGDPHSRGAAWQLDGETLDRCLAVAVDAGIRKFKFLGGEPLARRDLPERIGILHRRAPGADLSIITSGVGELALVEALFAAGLSRMNVSIHGFTLPAFAKRSRLPEPQYAKRAAMLSYLITLGRPLKLNFVYSGDADVADLRELLAWAAERGVLVNVLDDLNDPTLGAGRLARVLEQLRGPWARAYEEIDPDSLPTTRLAWADGLTVEVKTEQLGLVAPWQDCGACPARTRCREGIYAVRLTHQGRLQLCMDRQDLGIPLIEALQGGHQAAVEAWRDFVAAHLRCGPSQRPGPEPRQSRMTRLPLLQGGV